MQFKLPLLFLLTYAVLPLAAQENISAAAGQATSPKGNADFIIGQVTYATLTGPLGSVAQGVQQPYEISVLTALTGTEEIALVSTVYPNPVADIVTLSYPVSAGTKATAQLYDQENRLIRTEELNGTETKISFSQLPPSMYFLRIMSENSLRKTFKINKLQ